MKKIIILFFSFSLSAAPVQGAEKDSTSTLWTAMEATYIGLNVADLALTVYGLRHGGKEGNPLGAFLWRKGGTPLLVGFKAAMTCGVIYGLRQVKDQREEPAWITLAALNLLSSMVVYHNITIVVRL